MKGVHLARYFTTTLPNGERVTAPITSFLWAGCGYGGSCLPKDTKALSAHTAAHGQPMPLLDAVIRTNDEQPARMMTILRSHFPALKGVRVALLGLAFKEDTDDIRESPAIPIARMLVEAGAGHGIRPMASSVAAAAAFIGEGMPLRSRMLARRGGDAGHAVGRVPGGRAVARGGTRPLVIDGRRFIPRTAGRAPTVSVSE
jgi:UDPglucose 6-dehydrogenase/GDP-mannose 6-dehydrogenase